MPPGLLNYTSGILLIYKTIALGHRSVTAIFIVAGCRYMPAQRPLDRDIRKPVNPAIPYLRIPADRTLGGRWGRGTADILSAGNYESARQCEGFG